MKLTNVNNTPKLGYFIGNQSIWQNVGNYQDLLLKKQGNFLEQTGQHSVTYQTSAKLKAGQYYVYMFDNNSKVMDSRPDFSWKALASLNANGVKLATKSMYYKYLIDEKQSTFKLVKAFIIPYSPYVSDVQDYWQNIVADSGANNAILEYTKQGKLIQQLNYPAKSILTYRTFKYNFNQVYFSK